MPACRPAALRAFGSEEAAVGYGDGIGADPPARRGSGKRSWTSCSWPPMARPRAQIVEGPGRAVPLIIDNSSAFRLDPQVPLVVPEANGHAIGRRAGNLVANPNCTTAAAVIALAPIRDLAGLESVDLASYQAVSGAGRAALDAYEAERAAGWHRPGRRLAVPRPDRRQRGAADRRPGRRGLERRGAQDHGRAAQDPGAARPRRLGHRGPRAGPHRPLGRAPRPDEPRGPAEGRHGGAGRRAGARIPARHWQQSPSDAARRRRPRSRPGRPAAIHPGARAWAGAVPELRQPAQGRRPERDPDRRLRRSRPLRPPVLHRRADRLPVRSASPLGGTSTVSAPTFADPRRGLPGGAVRRAPGPLQRHGAHPVRRPARRPER